MMMILHKDKVLLRMIRMIRMIRMMGNATMVVIFLGGKMQKLYQFYFGDVYHKLWPHFFLQFSILNSKSCKKIIATFGGKRLELYSFPFKIAKVVKKIATFWAKRLEKPKLLTKPLLGKKKYFFWFDFSSDHILPQFMVVWGTSWYFGGTSRYRGVLWWLIGTLRYLEVPVAKFSANSDLLAILSCSSCSVSNTSYSVI